MSQRKHMLEGLTPEVCRTPGIPFRALILAFPGGSAGACRLPGGVASAKMF